MVCTRFHKRIGQREVEMITYKDVYENQRVGKIKEFYTLEELDCYVKDAWAYSNNTTYKVFPQEASFVPGKYFVSEKEFIAGKMADIIVSITGRYKWANKQTFVAGRIYNEDVVDKQNTIWRYFFRISE